MAETETLRRFVRRLDSSTRAQIIDDAAWLSDSEAVTRRDGTAIDIGVLADLMAAFHDRRDGWSDSSVSDGWLAPRLHYALRLTRAEAADPDVWAWLAVRFHEYVTWRWDGRKGVIEHRWRGAINKQALARLWWGAELFRNGSDYGPVERAFIRQDLPNSYLHRPIVRCRSLALALIDVIAPTDDQPTRSSGDVNDLARVLNLILAGTPPEAQTAFQRDDFSRMSKWIREDSGSPSTWDDSVPGPPCADTTPASLTGGRVLADRAWDIAHATAERLDTRSARRRASTQERDSTPT